MHDLVLDAAAALLALVAAVTFAAMIWAARQVDGRPHPTPRLRLPHLRRHA